MVLALSALRSAGPAVAAVPQLEHVFVIVDENTNFDEVFGTKAHEAPYLNGLADAHVRHDAYYGISHASLGNYTGMISGQIPHPLDHVDCTTYTACVRSGPTIAAQLDAAGKTWRGYFQSMPAPCTHPNGANDPYQHGYATRHNPFMYFSEIVNDRAYCNAHDVPYEPVGLYVDSFADDLANGPPSLSFIVPDTCDDGHDSGCKRGSPITVLDNWLEENVPPIVEYVSTHERSALFITFDEAESDDRTGCCDPVVDFPLGGGHIGLVMVAPGLERAQTRATTPANHYSLLRTIEDGFGLEPLGEAANVAPMADLFR